MRYHWNVVCCKILEANVTALLYSVVQCIEEGLQPHKQDCIYLISLFPGSLQSIYNLVTAPRPT